MEPFPGSHHRGIEPAETGHPVSVGELLCSWCNRPLPESEAEAVVVPLSQVADRTATANLSCHELCAAHVRRKMGWPLGLTPAGDVGRGREP